MVNSSGAILYVNGEKRSHGQRKAGEITDDYFAVSIPSYLYKPPAKSYLMLGSNVKHKHVDTKMVEPKEIIFHLEDL